MSVPTVVTLLYPATKKFDMDYYINTHMPLAEAAWKSQGLLSYTVSRVLGSDDHSVQCLLFFKSRDHQTAAFREHSDKVMADIVNFTDVQPTIITSEVVKSSL